MTDETHKTSLQSNPDYTARGIASEGLAALRSHEKFDEMRFGIMEKQHEEIKVLIAELREDMNTGFKSYDGKFWSLAITVIATLLTVVGALGWQIIMHGNGHP